MMTTTRGEWVFKWGGGRLADVSHTSKPGAALDCVQVGEYSFAWDSAELAEKRANVGRADLEAAADEWVRESGEDFARELPYLV